MPIGPWRAVSCLTRITEPSRSCQQIGYYRGSGIPATLNVGERDAGNVHRTNLEMAKRTMGWRILTVILLLLPGAFAQTAQTDPLTLRTRDAHQDLLIVADPYVSADRYKDKGTFGKKSPYEAGIVAINVYFRNDNDKQ